MLIITNGLVPLTGAMIGPIHALLVEQGGGTLHDASFYGGLFNRKIIIKHLTSYIYEVLF